MAFFFKLKFKSSMKEKYCIMYAVFTRNTRNTYSKVHLSQRNINKDTETLITISKQVNHAWVMYDKGIFLL